MRYFEALFNCFDDIAANPYLGKPRDDVQTGSRSFPQGRHVIFYEIDQSGIEILAIVHQSADVVSYLDVVE
jgi:toxin ParE1/3/4